MPFFGLKSTEHDSMHLYQLPMCSGVGSLYLGKHVVEATNLSFLDQPILQGLFSIVGLYLYPYLWVCLPVSYWFFKTKCPENFRSRLRRSHIKRTLIKKIKSIRAPSALGYWMNLNLNQSWFRKKIWKSFLNDLRLFTLLLCHFQ